MFLKVVFRLLPNSSVQLCWFYRIPLIFIERLRSFYWHIFRFHTSEGATFTPIFDNSFFINLYNSYNRSSPKHGLFATQKFNICFLIGCWKFLPVFVFILISDPRILWALPSEMAFIILYTSSTMFLLFYNRHMLKCLFVPLMPMTRVTW